MLQRTGALAVGVELWFDLGKSPPGVCEVAAAWTPACAVSLLVTGTDR